jgi:ribosomal protein L14
MEASVRFLDDKTVLVQTQSESKDGSTAGEVNRELKAGDSVWGYR